MKRMTLTHTHLQRRPKPPVDPRVKAMDVLDSGMQTALENGELPVEKRMQQYDQALARYMNVYDQYRSPAAAMREPPPSTKELPVEDTTDPIGKEVLDSVPASMRHRAEQLWQKMKSSRLIDWNDKRELVYRGERIKGSNVVDLVNDVLRKRKSFNPQGWEAFGDALREENVPQNLIGHDARWQYISKSPRRRRDSFSDSFETPMKTPPKKPTLTTPRLPKSWSAYKTHRPSKR